MRIIEAKPLDRFQLHLSFDNGERGIVDVSDLAGHGVFAAWNDPEFFNRVSITEQGALEWAGHIDLCPDAMYLRMTHKHPAEVFPNLAKSTTHA